MLKVGDRVIKYGWKWHGEEDRYGTVAECYEGLPSSAQRGVAMFSICWTDDHTNTPERGYIQGGGIKPAPLQLGALGV